MVLNVGSGRRRYWRSSPPESMPLTNARPALRHVDDLAEFRWALAQLTVRQHAVLVLPAARPISRQVVNGDS
jgi:hypothetical protein